MQEVGQFLRIFARVGKDQCLGEFTVRKQPVDELLLVAGIVRKNHLLGNTAVFRAMGADRDDRRILQHFTGDAADAIVL